MEGKRFGNLFFTTKVRENYLGEELRTALIEDEKIKEIYSGLVLSDNFDISTEELSFYIEEYSHKKQKNIIASEEIDEIDGKKVLLTKYIPNIRSLTEIIEAGEKRNNKLTLDNSLQIITSLLDFALSIKSEYGSELSDTPVLPIPDNVHLNSEGGLFYKYPFVNHFLNSKPEIKLAVKRKFRYLLKTGTEIDSKAEVYAFTSLFYYMITGKKITSGEDISSSQIASEKLAMGYESYKNIPEFIVPLIENGLTGGYKNLAEMQKNYERIILDGEITPSTFNLGFYLNVLFKKENDRELEAIEEEKSFTPPKDEYLIRKEKQSEIDKQIYEELEKSKSKKPLIIGGSIGAAVIIVAIIAFLLFRPTPKEEPEPITTKPVETQSIDLEKLKTELKQEMQDEYQKKIEEETGKLEEKYNEKLSSIEREDKQERQRILRQKQQEVEKIKKEKEREMQKEMKEKVQSIIEQETKEEQKKEKQKKEVEKAKEKVKTEPQIKEGQIVPQNTLDNKVEKLKIVGPTLTSSDMRGKNSIRLILQVLIDTRGKVETLRVISAKPKVPGIKTKLNRVINEWEFTVPLKNKIKVKTWKTLSLVFKK